MRYRIHRSRQIEEQPEQDVYFWDGEVCVTSQVVTVGNPSTNTISVKNLNGVSLSRGGMSVLPFFVNLICAVFFIFMGVSAHIASYKVFCWVLLGISAFIFYKLLRNPWEVTLKMGGILDDEVFSSYRKEWAEKFHQAVTDAISSGGGTGQGGQHVPHEAILPDPVFTRN